MSLILTRSPYFVSREDRDSASTLKLEILSGGSVLKTFNLAFRNNYLLDISPLVDDYFDSKEYEWITTGSGSFYTGGGTYSSLTVRTTLSGDLTTGAKVPDTVTTYVAKRGYLFSTDGYNGNEAVVGSKGVFSLSDILKNKAGYAGSSNVVYKLDDSNLRLPTLLPSGISGDLQVNYYSKSNELVRQETNSSISSDSLIVDYNYSSFKDRVTSDINFLTSGGKIEETKCLLDFLEDFDLNDVARIDFLFEVAGIVYRNEVIVKSISECKYNPYRVTFLNRWGIKEDLWFFKRSDVTLQIEKESYRVNSIQSYNASSTIKTYQDYNVNGVEKITLNSGFVEEEMNEAFKQLLLSEDVTIYDYKDNKEHTANISTSEFQYKQHINEKLINYTIEFKFAREVINNVG